MRVWQLYIFVFAGPILAVSSIWLLSVDPLDAMMFAVCYIWPLVLVIPGIADRAMSRKYRFSLLGLSYRCYSLVRESHSGHAAEVAARHSCSLLFTVIMGLISNGVTLISSLVGMLSSEFLLRLYQNIIGGRRP